MDIVWQSEDSLREKKVESDLKDLLKTMVAFANSVAPGDTARIFIGERNDGTVQGVSSPDNIQKKVRSEYDKIYPEIYYRTEVYDREGKQCVRVDIKHNGLAPHFGGAAWVREGSETIRATEELYQQLIDLRNEKIRVLAGWLNRRLSVEWHSGSQLRVELQLNAEYSYRESATLTYVGRHWITFAMTLTGGLLKERSEPLEKLLLSWDHENKQPKIIV